MSTGTQRRKDLIAQVEACVCKDRQQQYGDAEQNFQTIADYWNIWLKSRGLTAVVDATDVAMMSALIKVSRAAASPGHIDNWVDLCGYSICGGGIEVKKAADKACPTS